LTKELQFDIKIKSSDKTLDRLQGDWNKCSKSISDKYDLVMGVKKKK